MLRLGVADEMRILLAVVVLPPGEQLIAMAVAKFVQKLVGAVLNGAVAQRIHPDADGQASERIMVFGSRQHRSLIAQPPDVAEKSKDHQRRDANSNTDLYASESHPEGKFIWSATSRKITAGSRDGTCTYGESGRCPEAGLVRQNLHGQFVQFMGITEDEAQFARKSGGDNLLALLKRRNAAPVNQLLKAQPL
jgi:hypothetical protein